MSTKYTYQKEVNPPVLEDEIRKSEIVTALDFISTRDEYVDIFFKSDLSVADETMLTVIVGNHDPLHKEEEPPVMVKIIEDSSKDEKSFQTMTIGIDVPAASGWVEKDYVFPIDISIISCDLLIGEEHVGDILEVVVAPDKPVGALIQDASVGDTEIFVQDSVLEHIFVGYYTSITDGVNLSDLGRVLEKRTNSVVVEKAVDNDYSMASPTYFRMSIKLFNNWEMPGAGRIDIGDAKIGSSLIPKGITIRMRYFNKTNVAKRFVAPMDITY